jgi:hypothetical protein
LACDLRPESTFVFHAERPLVKGAQPRIFVVHVKGMEGVDVSIADAIVGSIEGGGGGGLRLLLLLSSGPAGIAGQLCEGLDQVKNGQASEDNVQQEQGRSSSSVMTPPPAVPPCIPLLLPTVVDC